MPLCSAKRELSSFLSHFEASTCSGSAGAPRTTHESPLFSVLFVSNTFSSRLELELAMALLLKGAYRHITTASGPSFRRRVRHASSL